VTLEAKSLSLKKYLSQKIGCGFDNAMTKDRDNCKQVEHHKGLGKTTRKPQKTLLMNIDPLNICILYSLGNYKSTLNF
jgi:hypothetical protein